MGKLIGKILDGVSVFFLTLTLILVVIQVIMRYIFDSPLTWSEELARYSLVWLGFLGSMIAMRERQHIDITVLVDVLPKKMRIVIELISKLISAAFLVLLTYYGVQFVTNNLTHKSPVTHLTMGYVYLCIPIAAIGMLLYMFVRKREE